MQKQILATQQISIFSDGGYNEWRAAGYISEMENPQAKFVLIWVVASAEMITMWKAYYSRQWTLPDCKR
jgi:hypothetical protein